MAAFHFRFCSNSAEFHIIEKRRFSAKPRGLESPQFILRTILVIIFHRSHQQHSERLSLQAVKQKVISISTLKVCLLKSMS